MVDIPGVYHGSWLTNSSLECASNSGPATPGFARLPSNGDPAGRVCGFYHYLTPLFAKYPLDWQMTLSSLEFVSETPFLSVLREELY